MTISQNGIELITSFEGFNENPYFDIAGDRWTIGFGNTYDFDDKPVTSKTPAITREMGLKLLGHAVLEVCTFINQVLKVEVSQNQFDSITSLTYNIGIGNFQISHLLRNLNSGRPVIADNFLSWDESGGKVIPGLLSRRQKEWEYYTS